MEAQLRSECGDDVLRSCAALRSALGRAADNAILSTVGLPSVYAVLVKSGSCSGCVCQDKTGGEDSIHWLMICGVHWVHPPVGGQRLAMPAS